MGELIDKAKGKIKQVVGTLAGDDKLKAEGAVDTLKGKAKGGRKISSTRSRVPRNSDHRRFLDSHTLEEEGNRQMARTP